MRGKALLQPSGGARTIVATKMAGLWFFICGFSKNERSNIDKDVLRVLQEVARELLGFDDRQLAFALAVGDIVEKFKIRKKKWGDN